jgi:hypothetical protein
MIPVNFSTEQSKIGLCFIHEQVRVSRADTYVIGAIQVFAQIAGHDYRHGQDQTQYFIYLFHLKAFNF